MAKTACAPCGAMSAEDKKREEQWRIEDDARTLLRAMEIRKDKNRLRKVRNWAATQAAELKAAAQ